MRKGMVMRDKLFLLQPDFTDPDYPGQRFFCWHCALLEGVLASFPEINDVLDIERNRMATAEAGGHRSDRRG